MASTLAMAAQFRYDIDDGKFVAGAVMTEVNKENLMSDIKTVLSDAEDLLKQAASTTGERATELREKALARLKQAKEKAADVQVVVVEKGKKAARATDDYVHDHPWTSIGVAAGVGILIGLLINRK
ncbi:ElaB protein [Mycetohabitans rhizoxinica HKI 454]|uniref:ElaB protein n=2 Tax=Mycetohabitans rhizoxinica TaxID=412963 RepID=E5ASG2_MYCRK|nr:ElaB protein [Mycetohabitans rhizoxinica HKI 454]